MTNPYRTLRSVIRLRPVETDRTGDKRLGGNHTEQRALRFLVALERAGRAAHQETHHLLLVLVELHEQPVQAA